MFHSRAKKLPERQAGVVALEFVVIVLGIVFMMAMLLQVGRTLIVYNVALSSSYSAAMHLATMPDSELKNSTAAKASTREIVQRMRQGGAIYNPHNTFEPTITCTPFATAPCAGTSLPTLLRVRIDHLQDDDIFTIFTSDGNTPIDSLFVRYRAGMPRVGFVRN